MQGSKESAGFIPRKFPESRAEASVDAEWNFLKPPPIEGVRLVDVKNLVIRGGALTEIFRQEWFGDDFPVRHITHVVSLPGTVSHWHCHHEQSDVIFPIRGYLRIGLYDARPGSPTEGASFVGTFHLQRPRYVFVPPGVWHALRNVGPEEAAYLVLNDTVYDYARPDDWKLPADAPDIPVSLD
jgi:dTDP-4-dehydrorhamnose 3,5-epimerase